MRILDINIMPLIGSSNQGNSDDRLRGRSWNLFQIAGDEDDADDEELREQIKDNIDSLEGETLKDVWPTEAACPRCHFDREKRELFYTSYWHCSRCDG